MRKPPMPGGPISRNTPPASRKLVFKYPNPPRTARLWLAQMGLCFHCRQPMTLRPGRAFKSDRGWTREHVIPFSKGGRGSNNIVLAHGHCNGSRSNKDATVDQLQRNQDIQLLASSYPNDLSDLQEIVNNPEFHLVPSAVLPKVKKVKPEPKQFGFGLPIDVGEPKFVPPSHLGEGNAE